MVSGQGQHWLAQWLRLWDSGWQDWPLQQTRGLCHSQCSAGLTVQAFMGSGPRLNACDEDLQAQRGCPQQAYNQGEDLCWQLSGQCKSVSVYFETQASTALKDAHR